MKNIVVLFSGRGSNMIAIARACEEQGWPARIAAVISNRPDAAGLQAARQSGLRAELLDTLVGRCDLVLLDAFSPQRCPQLWSLEFLEQLVRLLRPDGRLLTYSSAAAVGRCLQGLGLELRAIRPPPVLRAR